MARTPAVQEIEALPEADRLEGFPHPRETRDLFGHEAAEKALAEALAGGRMHHAWLLAGREGIGKATLAYRFARHALAAPHERDPFHVSLAVGAETAAARQVRALSHPGLLVIRRVYDTKTKRFSASIPVEEVRRLRTFLSHSAAEGHWRVVLVDSADEFNINAANALLKSLEEPPVRTVFLLISSEPGRLLPTIRSRCRTLDLPALSGEPLRRAARAAMIAAETDQPDGKGWELLERLSRGSVRRLLTLSTGGGLALYERVTKLVGGLPKVDWGLLHTLSDELAGAAAEQKFEMYYDLLLDLLARLVRAAASGEGSAEDLETARRIIPAGRLASWAELWETVVREKADALALNLDRKTLILDTFSRLESVARR